MGIFNDGGPWPPDGKFPVRGDDGITRMVFYYVDRDPPERPLDPDQIAKAVRAKKKAKRSAAQKMRRKQRKR